jgi:diacylglycerol kinase (ATP)
MRTVQLIVNPIAGKGHSVAVVPAIEACLRRLGYTPATFVTHKRGEAQTFAASLYLRTALILAIGGDGTLNEVINGQIHIPLALFPMGTGNAFARDQGILGQVDFLEGLLRNGVVQCFDLGQAGGKKFLNMAACGILGEIHRRFWEQRRGPDSLACCLTGAFSVLRRRRFPPVTVWCDGQLITRTARIVVIGNTRTYAAGIRFTPLASPVDGVFDVCTFPQPSRLDWLKWFVGVLRQRHPHYDGICYRRGRTIHLAGDGIACHVDGEYIGQAPLTVSILARSAPILVPTVNILKADASLRRPGCDRSAVFSLQSPELAVFISNRGAA